MKITTLKKLRLQKGLTQKEIAVAMETSQPNYHRWESYDDKASIPENKINQLAKLLGVTRTELIEGHKPFDTLNIDSNIDAEQTYYGEVAVHFLQGKPLLYPISLHEVDRLFDFFNEARDETILSQSLDNRLILLKASNIKDVFFTSENHDGFGPEKYDGYIGLEPNSDYWEIVAGHEFGDLDEFDSELVDRIINSLDADYVLKQKVAVLSDFTEETKRELFAEIKTEIDTILERATCITWQLSDGSMRSETCPESESLINLVDTIDIGNGTGDYILLEIEGYHNACFVNKTYLNYLTIPSHLYENAEMETLEDMDN